MIIIYFFCEFVATFLESYLCYKFSDLFLTQKMNNRNCLQYALILTVIIIVVNSYSLFTISTLVFAVIFVSISSKVFFDIPLFNIFSVSSFYSFFLLFFDFFSMALLGLIFQNSDFAIDVIKQQSSYRCCFLLLSKSVLLVCYIGIRKALVRSNKFKINNLFFITLLGYIGIIYLAQLTFEYINYNLMIHWFLFFVIIILILFSLIAYIRYIKETEEKKLMELRNNAYADKFNDVFNIYKENAQLYHDMKNHLEVLYDLIQNSMIISESP